MADGNDDNALIDGQCASAVAALDNDPFYRSICGAHARDDVGRQAL